MATRRERPAFGFEYLVVEVTDVTERYAEVLDQFERTLYVATDIRRGNGPKPRVGETWIIDQSIADVWTFAACLTPVGDDVPLFIQPEAPTSQQIGGADRFMWWQTGDDMTLWIEDGT